MKRHVRQHLISEGVLTEQNVTRTPKPRHCRDCGRVVIAAITDLGFEVAVEPSATAPAGELATLLSGGETYALLDHGEMVWRDQRRITYRNADRERTHARHECGKGPPEVNPLFVEMRTRTNFDGPIPF